MRSVRARRLIPAAIIAAAILSACTDAEATITGEIRDDSIVLEQDSGPQSVWLQLSNVGDDPCELVVIRSELAPDALPLDGERLALNVSGSPADRAYPMDAYVEIDRQPVTVEDPVRAGRHALVDPGRTARVQLALTSVPEAEERVIACNGPGDYEAGRYAVLRFDR